MTEQIPTPTPEQVQQWLGEYFGTTSIGEISDVEHVLATRAARWGADQELKACCEFLEARHASFVSRDLHAARRPKPQSLAEEALLAIDTAVADGRLSPAVAHAVRRALKRLQELEGLEATSQSGAN